MSRFAEHWQWPLGAVVLLACVLVYRHLLRKAETYTQRVKHELEAYVRQSIPSPAPLPIPPRNTSDSATLADEKHAIWQKINAHPLPNYQQVDLLVHQLAEARLACHFQDTYFTIFGSQQAFLRRLNSQTGSGALSREASQAFFEQQAVANPDVTRAGHDFNRWLAFLVSRGLVNVGVDWISITNGGQDFLVWIMRRQLPDRTYEGL